MVSLDPAKGFLDVQGLWARSTVSNVILRVHGAPHNALCSGNYSLQGFSCDRRGGIARSNARCTAGAAIMSMATPSVCQLSCPDIVQVSKSVRLSAIFRVLKVTSRMEFRSILSIAIISHQKWCLFTIGLRRTRADGRIVVSLTEKHSCNPLPVFLHYLLPKHNSTLSTELNFSSLQSFPSLWKLLRSWRSIWPSLCSRLRLSTQQSTLDRCPLNHWDVLRPVNGRLGI